MKDWTVFTILVAILVAGGGTILYWFWRKGTANDLRDTLMKDPEFWKGYGNGACDFKLKGVREAKMILQIMQEDGFTMRNYGYACAIADAALEPRPKTPWGLVLPALKDTSEPFQLEPFEPNKYKALAVFALGDGYWWIGYDIPSCLADAIQNYDAEATEDVCYQLTDEELDRIKFKDEDEDVVRTFREQFEIEKAKGGEFPRLFASEDW